MFSFVDPAFPGMSRAVTHMTVFPFPLGAARVLREGCRGPFLGSPGTPAKPRRMNFAGNLTGTVKGI